MRIDFIEDGVYGVYLYSNEYGRECLFTGSFLECSEFMYFNL